jgi:hypothetical protein
MLQATNAGLKLCFKLKIAIPRYAKIQVSKIERIEGGILVFIEWYDMKRKKSPH